METNYIKNCIQLFTYYKKLGNDTFAQLNDQAITWQYNEESNSIATIVKHLWGNMLSRWTDFLTTDGEKPWRQRDAEFENDTLSKAQMIAMWEEGWACLFTALNSLTENDLNTIIYIRNEGHSVQEAINRQLAHYPYHIGQIVYTAKMIQNTDWKTLSIARKSSADYNKEKFSQEKGRRNFTDALIK